MSVFVTLLLVSCSGSSAGAPLASIPASPTRALFPSEVVVGGSPCGMTYLNGSVWVSDLATDRVVRVDAATRAVLGTFPVGRSPCSMVADASEIWVAPSEEGVVQVLDSTTGLVLESVEISTGAADAKLAAGFGSIWATATPEGDVVRIDPQQRDIVTRIEVGKDPRGVAVGGGLVWVAVEGSNRVVAIDPSTNDIVRSFRLRTPSAIVVATKRSVWVGQLLAERTSNLRAETGRVTRNYPLESNPQPGVLINGEVWSPDHLNSVVLRFQKDGGVRRSEVGTNPSALVRLGDEVWVANFGDGTLSILDASSP